MPFYDVTINFARAVLHYDKQQLDDGQHTATAARRSLPMFLVYKGVVVDRCRVLLCFSYHFICYFTYLRPPCYLVLDLLPSSLWSSLLSNLTNGKFYALANELTLAIRK